MITADTVPAETLAALATVVEARSGLRFVGGRQDELAIKVVRAFAESECATWTEYQLQVMNGRLFEQLVEMLTIGETYFYRHRPYFDMLEREILPEIIARRRDTKRLRIWCAGCATGEEAYSLAIAVRTVLPDVDDWQITLAATDLNRAFLARAEAGLYGEWSFRETDVAFRMANFVPEGRRFRIRPEIRQMVRFAQLNLADDGYPAIAAGTAGVDLVLCRNVLLYFGQELTQRIVGRFHTALVPGGWLVLGPSDPRPGLLADFAMHAGDGAVVYRRIDRAELPSTRAEAALRLVSEPAVSVLLGEPSPVRAAVSLRKTSARRSSLGKTHHPEGPPKSERSEADGTVSQEGDWHEAWTLARASADVGELDLAEEHCQRAIARGQLRPEPHYLFGALRQARGDDAGSLEAYRKALYVDPRFVPALFAQAAIHRRGGAPERARQSLIRAQRLLEGRVADEWVLVDDGLTVGRLRDAVAQALRETLGAA